MPRPISILVAVFILRSSSLLVQSIPFGNHNHQLRQFSDASPITEVTSSTSSTSISLALFPGESSASIPSPTTQDLAPTQSGSMDSDYVFFLPDNAIPTASTSAIDPTASTSDPTSTQSVQPSSTTTYFDEAYSPSSQLPASQVPLVMAYYPDWTSTAFPPEKIDFSRIDWVDFAFAVPNDQFQLGWDGSDNAPDVLNRLVTAAHTKGKKVKLSIGGWTGSKFFSSAVSTPDNRQTFASNIQSLYRQFNLDGIDIDWEYPGQPGDSGNRVSSDDTQNFLEFLSLLRTTLPQGAKITAATMTVPFADENGNAMKDVSAFAQVLDWVLVMNYDTWGSSTNPGPNAPLNDACHNSTQSNANALSAVETWTKAGFPASQIVLGVPSYGYISRTDTNTLRTRRSLTSRQLDTIPAPLADLNPSTTDTSKVIDDGASGISADAVKNGAVLATNEDGGTDDGQVQFRNLVDQGVLRYVLDPSNPNSPDAPRTSSQGLVFGGRLVPNLFDGFNQFTRQWDECSNTPFLHSKAARQVITYDDPQSLEMKASFVLNAGLKGVNMFDIHGDTDEWDLVDGIRRGLGLA